MNSLKLTYVSARLPLLCAMLAAVVFLTPRTSHADVRVQLGFGPPPIYQAPPPPPPVVYQAQPQYPWYYGPEYDYREGYGHGGNYYRDRGWHGHDRGHDDHHHR